MHLSGFGDGLVQGSSSVLDVHFKLAVQFVCGLVFLSDWRSLSGTQLHQLRSSFIHLVNVWLVLCYQLPHLLKMES